MGRGETRKQKFVRRIQRIRSTGIITEIETRYPLSLFPAFSINAQRQYTHYMSSTRGFIPIVAQTLFSSHYLHHFHKFANGKLLLLQQTGCCDGRWIIAIDRPRKRIGVAGALVLTVRARNSRDTNSRARV